MRRLLTPAGIAILITDTLATCQPAAEPIIALALRTGKPTAVLLACGQSFSQISVFEYDNQTPGPAVTVAVMAAPGCMSGAATISGLGSATGANTESSARPPCGLRSPHRPGAAIAAMDPHTQT